MPHLFRKQRWLDPAVTEQITQDSLAEYSGSDGCVSMDTHPCPDPEGMMGTMAVRVCVCCTDVTVQRP